LAAEGLREGCGVANVGYPTPGILPPYIQVFPRGRPYATVRRLANSPHLGAARQRASEAVRGGDLQMTSRYHILIIDDAKDDRELYAYTLTRKGYRVSQAVDGADGLAKTAAVQPDLILMDIWLPQVGGWTAMRMLKEDERTRQIPVIIVTGQSYVAYSVLANLAEGLLVKPCHPEALLAEVERLLARHGKAAGRLPAAAAASAQEFEPPDEPSSGDAQE